CNRSTLRSIRRYRRPVRGDHLRKIAGALGIVLCVNIAAAQTAKGGPAGVGHCVSFPPGRFTFASAITFRLPDGGASATLTGAGSDVTELSWPQGGGLTFEFV